jgi:acetyltransferase-like isoleucine patch superfamily enzyme
MFWINGVSVGKNMKVYNRFYLSKHKDAKVNIGDSFVFTSGEAFNPLSRNIRGGMYLLFPTSEITIGNDTGISSSCLRCNERITIGNRVKIGADCIIMDTDGHNLDYRVRSSKEMIGMYCKDAITAVSSPITIEDDVLIGTRCIILKGVTIGARSVIGSDSVVTKSIPKDCIAAGNPCRVIRKIQ